jgi:hypothetical protein
MILSSCFKSLAYKHATEPEPSTYSSKLERTRPTGNLAANVTVRPRPVGPDGCGPVTATGNRENKETRIRPMSGPMSERAPDITVEADGRTESTTVLANFESRVPPIPLS